MSSNANQGPVVAEDINRLMQVGTSVLDTTGKRIGKVEQFDLTAGYMQVHHGGWEPQSLYIPFQLLATIDARAIYLTLKEDALLANYATLPTSVVVLQQWRDWRTGRTESTVGHEMLSGYSGKPVTAFQQNYDELARQLFAGMSVYDIGGANLGKIVQFDSDRGWLSVEKGVVGATMMFIPFSAIARVEIEDDTVALLVPKEALQNDLAALLPVPPASSTLQPGAHA